MVTYAEGVLIPGQISVALSRGNSPQVKPVDKTTGVGKNWVRGQIVFLNATPDKFEVATAGSVSEEFGVATEDAEENDPKGHIAAEGTAVAVKLAGTVVPNNRLKAASAGTATGAAGGETAGMWCGDYLGHPEQTDGKTPVTQGVLNEVVYMLVHRN
jgi:hypothetical protein